MDSLSLKKNLLIDPILSSTVVIVLCLLFSNILDSLSSMENLKFSTFLGHMLASTLLYSTLVILVANFLPPKIFGNTWVFIFNKKLMFYQHIKYYANEAILTVKCIKLLRNLTRGLLPI